MQHSVIVKQGGKMAHSVTVVMPRRKLERADVVFDVKQDGEAFGTLLVSKGSVVWRRAKKSVKGRKLGWTNFDKFMNKHGRLVKGG